MKRIFPISILLLVLIATFFAYNYFKSKQKNSVWNDSWYQPDQFASSAVEPVCEVEIPIYNNETGNESSKSLYLVYQISSLAKLPTNIMPGKRESSHKDIIKMGYQKECPTVFNYFLLYDLYPDHLQKEFFKYNQEFETQSSFLNSSDQQCELTISLPHIYEDTQVRLNQYLKLHLKSFERILDINELDGVSIQAQLSFNSSCDQVLADYLMQDLLPADYFQMTQ